MVGIPGFSLRLSVAGEYEKVTGEVLQNSEALLSNSTSPRRSEGMLTQKKLDF